jgi:hypothetical protein
VGELEVLHGEGPCLRARGAPQLPSKLGRGKIKSKTERRKWGEKNNSHDCKDMAEKEKSEPLDFTILPWIPNTLFSSVKIPKPSHPTSAPLTFSVTRGIWLNVSLCSLGW